MNKFTNKNPFKTPEGYFEDISKGLMKRLREKDIDIPDNEGFIVPDSYFDDVHKNILEKQEAEEAKIIQLHPFKKLVYAAASIAAIAMVVFFLNLNTSEAITFDTIANSDIDDYFEDNDLDFSTYEIAELVPVDELEIGDILSNELNQDMILNYLDNNTENFEELNMDYDE